MIILHTESSPGWGGQEFRVLAEADAMRRRGHTVLIAAAPAGRILHRAQEQGFATVAAPFRHRFDLDAIAQVRAAIRRHRVEVVNTHSAIDGWVGALATCYLPGVAVVRTRHLSIPVHRNWPTRWVYTRGCHAIITTGEALRLQLMRENGFDGDRIVSIPTGFDPERFDPARADRGALRAALRAQCPDLGDDEPLIGCIAMLRSMKGHPVLVEAFAQVLRTHPRLRLVLVGEQPHQQSTVKADLVDQCQRLGLGTRVIFAGYRDDIPQVLAGLDAVVLPSLRDEGVPQGLTQALAMGVPVIATAVGAVAEIVRPEETGLLVPPGDAAALAAAIIRLREDPAGAQRRAAAGRALVLREYTVAAMAERVEALYLRVLASLR
jgi:glycosyltransferase involved in cell wall biosynthesis